LNISNVHWSSDLLIIAGKRKPSKSLLKIYDAGFKTLQSLLWILPLRINESPRLKSFDFIEKDHLFLGKGTISNISFTPAFGRRGKGKIQLFNLTCLVRDHLSDQTLVLKWFNIYPTMKKQLEAYESIVFLGEVSEYKGILQIINPSLNPKIDTSNSSLIIEYPTVNTVPGKFIKEFINKIPDELWNLETESFFKKNPNQMSILEAFKTLHGRGDLSQKQLAKDRIIYEEFFQNQLKVLARKLKNKSLRSTKYLVSEIQMNNFLSYLPYELTKDQNNVLEDIKQDLSSGHPMMRMIQGDVGCGKTSVAILASLIVTNQGGQVAFMCPTEALAKQHFQTISEMQIKELQIDLLLGSSKPKEKKEIINNLNNGKINLIIGTHALFQDSVEFKNLQLAIIDEQHKFGVDQRQSLVNKGKNTHTLIMTATPIPRSLQLAQYGDLDISTIRELPSGRKGIQTRIVSEKTYDKYLSFIKTRASLGEQIYIVVPAIEESETLAINNVNSLILIYKKFFPELIIEALHGQLKNDEKQSIMDKFVEGKIHILISTTVIEVGINVLNSTVISIYNPERFGLSSLHQLRGRVGRGGKAGFCFLISEKSISPEALQRLKIIEKTIDGFEISEADLQNRGQGDLFGNNQSGHGSNFKIANIIEHFSIFETVTQDINQLKINSPEVLNNFLLNLVDESKISLTI